MKACTLCGHGKSRHRHHANGDFCAALGCQCPGYKGEDDGWNKSNEYWLTHQRAQLNAWREVGQEVQRILTFLSSEQRSDLCPDWFEPRLSELLQAAKNENLS